MSSTMWRTFNAGPKRRIISHLHALIHKGLISHLTGTIAHDSVNAVIGYFASRTNRVDVVFERPIFDAVRGTNTVATKAGLSI
jgi:hypothetical protein